MTQWTGDEMHTAMCLWEAWLELENQGDSDAAKLARQIREDHGTCTLRLTLIGLVRDCDTAWEAAHSLGYDLPFDWEFVPEFLAQAVQQGRIKIDLTSWWAAA